MKELIEQLQKMQSGKSTVTSVLSVTNANGYVVVYELAVDVGDKSQAHRGLSSTEIRHENRVAYFPVGATRPAWDCIAR